VSIEASLSQLNPSWKLRGFAAVQRDMKPWNSNGSLREMRLPVRMVHPNQIVRVGIVELETRALVEYIRIDTFGTEQ
jgi:hypothetical protein